MDETSMYYDWHLVMLELRIIPMLLGGVSQKLAS